MSTRLSKYIQHDGVIYSRYVNTTEIVSEESASLEIIAPVTTRPWSTHYLYIDKLMFSVFKAATGGAGICEIKSALDGEVIWTVDVSTVKDFVFDWGEAGLRSSTTTGEGIQVVVSGGGTQASVSVGIEAHYELPGEN